MPNYLVIGYGNTLRRDDGVGVKVAEAIAKMDLPGVEVMTAHQLLPEFAEPISRVKGIIFVDAKNSAEGEVEMNSIEARVDGQILAHATNPSSLLGLSQKLFGRSPKAWALTIPAEDFDFGDGLSSLAENGLRRALGKIQNLLTSQHD